MKPGLPYDQILETWLKLSSTGVSRPKMDTNTFNFCWSALISEIVAGSEANAPSVTVTESPTSKSTTLISCLTAPPPDAAFSS
jgi:hypothetical protein